MAKTGAIRAGRAFVELFAEDTQLKRGLRRASGALRAFGAQVTAMAAAVAVPMGVMARQFARQGDDLHKMSQRTGATTEELSKLGHAAERSGASMGDVETALRGLSRQMDAAKRGSGEAAQAFDRLGINVAALAKKSPTQAMEILADRLSGVDNATERAALAMQVFGRSGTALLPMLNDGADGLQAFWESAEKLGLVIDSETAAAAAKLQDNLSDMLDVVKHIGFVIGSSLADELKKATTAITEFGVKAADWVRQNKELIVTTAKISVYVGAMGTAMFALGKVIGGVLVAVKALTAAKIALAKAKAVAMAMMGPKGWLILAGSIAAATGAVIAMERSLASIKGTAAEQVEAMENVADAADAVALRMGQVGKAAVDFRGTPLSALGREADELGMDRFERVRHQMMVDDTWNAQAEELWELYRRVILEKEELIALENDAADIIAAQATAQDHYNAAVEKANRLLEKGLLTQQQYAKEVERQEQLLADATRDHAAEQAARDAERLYEATRTPMERYAKEVEHINDLHARGMIDAETHARAMDQARGRLPQELDIGDIDARMAKLATAGGFSGFAQFGAEGQAAADRTADATEKMSKDIQEMLQLQRDNEETVV